MYKIIGFKQVISKKKHGELFYEISAVKKDPSYTEGIAALKIFVNSNVIEGDIALEKQFIMSTFERNGQIYVQSLIIQG